MSDGHDGMESKVTTPAVLECGAAALLLRFVPQDNQERNLVEFS